MNFLSFMLELADALLNAAAQLLRNAGPNGIGALAFSADNLVPAGINVASNPFIAGGLGCYAVVVGVFPAARS